MLDEAQTQAVFVLMPHPTYRDLDPALKRAVEQTDAWFVDLRDLYPRVKEHFPDGHHMDVLGAEIYSRAVADAVADRLSRSQQLLAVRTGKAGY
jgi:hypothetical protein